MATSASSCDLELKLAELKINGFATFEDLIPGEKIDRIRTAFLPLLEQVTAAGAGEKNVAVRGHSAPS